MGSELQIRNVENLIYTIRENQVMLDNDLAELYNVQVKRLNEQVKRNIDRFPGRFRFQLTDIEWESLRSQNATLEGGRGKHKKYLPYVFTEQGVSMLSAVLRSETAVKVSVAIMDAFVQMRKQLANNDLVLHRLDRVEQKQLETDHKFEQVFKALESRNQSPEKGIFFNGQVFDAYTFVADIVRSAKQSIILIDNYIDDTVFTVLTKRNKKVSATIYTHKIDKQLNLDLKKHNAQYPPIEVKLLKNAHDRFLIIDEKELYHIGASLKDLGKKWFAFSKMNTETLNLLMNLKNKEMFIHGE